MKKFLLFILPLFFIHHITNSQITQLWGTTEAGGVTGEGTIFRMNPDGTGFNTVFSFASPYGWKPIGNLLQASNGKIYGTCYEGGTFASCTIYCYDPDTDTCVDVHDFDIDHGDFPQSGVIEAGNGVLYGVASTGGTDSLFVNYGVGVIYSFNTVSNVYTQEHIFSDTVGYYPLGSPVLVGNKLYGMTHGIEFGFDSSIAGGSIYSFDIITKVYARLLSFDSTTGGAPSGSFLQHGNGKLYGLTDVGGSHHAGTIFSFDPSNNVFQKLYDFDNTLGAHPKGTLMQAGNGKLYGATSEGGSNGKGVIFSFDISSNTYSCLYHFDGINGAIPLGNLTEYGSNKLYGTAFKGGTVNAGVIFTFDLNNDTYTPLLNFDGANGQAPNCGLIAASTDIISGVSIARASQNQLVAYPNPAISELYIDLNTTEAATIRLYNLDGKEVMENEQPLLWPLDISNLPVGVYIAEVTVRGLPQRLRWVKM